jgi:hypothetical protein
MHWRTKPSMIRSDNGHEFINLANKTCIHIAYIQPENLQQKADIERANRNIRYS